MTRLAAALLLCALVLPARAQSLPDVLVRVYETSPTLLQARAQLKSADNTVSQALAGWRPSVIVNGNYGYTRTRTRTRESFEGYNFSIYGTTNYTPGTGTATISQPLTDGGRTTAQTDEAKNAVLAQRARVLAQEMQSMNDAANAYVSVVRDTALLDLNNRYIQLVEAALQATQRRLTAGEVTRTDVAQAQTRLASARVAQAQAAASLETSRATFRQVTGIDAGTLTPPPPLKPAEATLKSAEAVAAVDAPTVTAALFDYFGSRNAVRVQIAALLPSLNAQAEVFRNDNYGARGSRYTGESFTLNLSVPIYQGGAEYAAVRQAQNQLESSRHALAEQRRLAEQAAHTNWSNYAAAQLEFSAAVSGVQAAATALDGVQREALIGSRTTLDVLNAELELLQARENRVQAVAALVQTSYTLNQALGRLSARDLNLPIPPHNWDEHYRISRDALFGFERGGN